MQRGADLQVGGEWRAVMQKSHWISCESENTRNLEEGFDLVRHPFIFQMLVLFCSDPLKAFHMHLPQPIQIVPKCGTINQLPYGSKCKKFNGFK